jgi:hypothetical protein
MTYPNPYVTTLPPDSTFTFTAMSHASYYQRATVSVNGTTVVIFNGNGEGFPMVTPQGETSYEGATRGKLQASILFQFSVDGSDYINAAIAQVSGTASSVTIGTENSNDGDNNDTVLTLTINPL